MKTTEKAKSAFDGMKQVGDDVKKAGRSMWLAGLGMVAYAEEEGRGLIDKLVDKGESFEKSDRNVVGKRVEEFAGKAKDFGREAGDRV